jgi:serine/threonine protein kinase
VVNPRNAPPIPPPLPGTDESSGPSDSSPTTIGDSSPPPQPRRQMGISTPTTAFTPEELREKAEQSARAAYAPRPASGTNPNAFPPFPQPAPGPPPSQRVLMQPPHPRVTPPPPYASQTQQLQPRQPHPSQGHMGMGMPPPSGISSHQSGQMPAVQMHGSPYSPPPPPMPQTVGLRTELPREVRPASSHVVRSRAYAFVLDARGQPIELGSGRFAKVFLGEERWLESKTDFRRPVVIKILQKGVSDDDRLRFQVEKELLERVQGHPNIVTLFASGESDDPEFIPPSIRDKVENDFLILERLDMSLEERLKGSRARKRDDLLACDMRERLFRVLDYMIPVASAIEYAHLVRNICHRDIKPANILVGLPDEKLRGSTLEVRLTDFNVAKLHDEDVSFQMTQMKSVPGTLFFQSPEQETNVLELLVNTQQGSPEIEFFEDFYIQIAKNDSFALFNRGENYHIQYCDRVKKRIVLDRPYRDTSEMNVRAKVQKSVGRPADIYSLGATFYYLISGAYSNPKTLYDAFHKFIEYEQPDETNSIEGYLNHEYTVIDSIRAPKEQGVNVAPADRFFTYKHYLDGNGELIDPQVMKIIAKCMIRNKPDSYCQAHEIDTPGVSELVQDLVDLYALYGFHPNTGGLQLARRGHVATNKRGLFRRLGGFGTRIGWMFRAFFAMFRRRR